MPTKLTYLLLVIILCVNPCINSYGDTLNLSEKWTRLVPLSMSVDGNWLFYENHNINNPHLSSRHIINTRTKENITIKNKNILFDQILKNNLAIAKEKDKLIIYDLKKNNDSLIIPDVKNFKIDSINSRIVLLTNSNNLRIYDLTLDNDLIIFNQDQIDSFAINPNSSFLIYQEKSPLNNVYSLNLKTLHKEFLFNSSNKISSFLWNQHQDHVVIDTKTNYTFLVNLINSETSKINLDVNNITGKNVRFFSNNDLLITYSTVIQGQDSVHRFLDIWSSTSKNLSPSDFTSKQPTLFQAKIYKYTTKKTLLVNKLHNQYIYHIPIPNHTIVYSPLKEQDFLNTYPYITYYLKNTINNELTKLTRTRSNKIFPSLDGNYLLYPTSDPHIWEIFTITTKNRLKIKLSNNTNFTPIWSKDSKYIYFQESNNLARLKINSGTTEILTNNTKNTKIIIESEIKKHHTVFIDSSKPIIFKSIQENKSALFRISDNRITQLSNYSTNKLSDSIVLKKLINVESDTYIWEEQNYNLPNTIYINKNNKTSSLIKNDMDTSLYNWQKTKEIVFKDSKGVELAGILFYPKNFNKNKKYPMVTIIYEKVWSHPLTPNIFIEPTLLNRTGVNRTLLTELGYFVFLADTYVNEKGPGLTAVDCVENAVKKILSVEPAINKNKIGLSGHSFGGYKAGFIATHSKMFAAIISASAVFDLIGDFNYRYNPNRKLPEYSRLETGQFQMLESYAKNPLKYLNNSTLLHADKVSTPILLFIGLKDENAYWEQTRTMFMAMRRYNKKNVVALFYNNIGHDINLTQETESKDFSLRYIEWFNYYLKDIKDIKWIAKNTNS